MTRPPYGMKGFTIFNGVKKQSEFSDCKCTAWEDVFDSLLHSGISPLN